MASARRLYNLNNGLSKKDDDAFHPLRAQSDQMFLNTLRRRRLLLALAALLLIYVFVKNIPTDVPSVGRRYNSNYGSLGTVHSKLHPELLGEDVVLQSHGLNSPHDEPIRFHNLAATLREFGPRAQKRHVVYALPKADSAAKLLPVACQMAQNNRSTIHIALLGKQAGTIEEIMRLNGIKSTNCPVHWHDATPDHAKESSENRIHASVTAGLSYIQSALQPQVFLIDDFGHTDPGLMNSLKSVISRAGSSLITFPAGAQQSMSWMALLDGSALKSFNDFRIEIVIQPYSESAGSLIRLLHSLSRADYHGLPVPRLTIELPAQADASLLNFLSGFSWPPGTAIENSQLTLRRRIDFKQLTPAMAALRTIESFYPVPPSKSHVLVLNTNVELSPIYLHYLIFTVLEYMHAERSTTLYSPLIGISLDLPQQVEDSIGDLLESANLETSEFVLAQSPNSNAALYFGSKWIELHSFLSHRLAKDPELNRDSKPDHPAASKHQHQWLVQALEFMQARQLYMLYPMFARQSKEGLATMHTDLNKLPEEYMQVKNVEEPKATPFSASYDFSKILDNDVLNGDYDRTQGRTESHLSSSAISVVSLLAGYLKSHSYSILPELGAIPLLSPSGEVWDWAKSFLAGSVFAEKFALAQGGCSSLEQRDKTHEGTVDFLFCDTG